MKHLIIKIIKGIVFGFFILGFISQIFSIVSEGVGYPYSTTGGIIGALLFLLLIYYLLFKCKYKWIKNFFRKQTTNS